MSIAVNTVKVGRLMGTFKQVCHFYFILNSFGQSRKILEGETNKRTNKKGGEKAPVEKGKLCRSCCLGPSCLCLPMPSSRRHPFSGQVRRGRQRKLKTSSSSSFVCLPLFISRRLFSSPYWAFPNLHCC